MDRKQQQAELIYKFGQLVRPLVELVEYPDQQTSQTRARASAKYMHDLKDMIHAVQSFSRGEPGHKYDVEHKRAAVALHTMEHSLASLRDDSVMLCSALGHLKREVIDAISAIPTEMDSQVLEAHSPFQAYVKLKAFFETTTTRLIWADPYMGPGLFHRYLNDLPGTVALTLITKDRGTNAEYASFLDISKLYANERGPTNYRLIVEGSNHDRWLRCDDQLYHLGGSAKDAGHKSPFTLTKLEPSPANFQRLDDLITGGRELFGPTNTCHP